MQAPAVKTTCRPGQFKSVTGPTVRFWQWPNLLGIDAALVALLWQQLYAAAWNVPVTPGSGLILALSVWLAYTADRLLDVRGRNHGALLSTRHRFARRHWRVLAGTWIGTLVINIVFAAWLLTAEELLAGLLLLPVCLLYTLWNALRPKRQFPKEAVVGLLFAAGIAVFVPVLPQDRLSFTLALIPFAAICTYNCLVLARTEHQVDRALGVTGMAGNRQPGQCSLAVAGGLILVSTLLAPDNGLRAPLAGAQLMQMLLLVPARFLNRESFRVLLDTTLVVLPAAALLI